MLLGTHTPKLDDKGRIILPAKFRDELADGVVITRGQERCLYVFSAKEFQDVHDKVRQAPVTSEEARRYLRVFLSGASDETPDKQGRVLVPALLREYADLTKELVIIGVGSRAEIWDAAAWQTYLSSNEETFASQAQEVIPGLF
ncbi:MAG: division/cell wall cluster transcriptional repressor MraZ [Micrococcales bacterium]|jgi:MraZ protein|nr:division/cell wall cluster transcriptional repressor MraZ [Micrococcales bacterium]MDG1818030.1 division/cell wall cluster transcriptional repressor MraZ [Aquiluna sp.]MBT5398269.1 division/cell wall cluster transcriptional repressor MraZ [Micrococcales bacterium]MBT5431632.1 division/cell wall cluster transcriptional repressor MraZ [Micrococcales bacterium]MBT5848285.1 division/cell wall cluster transcriptional repressor MraZ [Micrococcales bacterium]